MELFELKSLWGNFAFEFAVSSARGLSGGIISMWDPAVFVHQKISCFDNMVVVQGEWIASKLRCSMVNVYAPQQDNQKRLLWEQILGFMTANPGEFVIVTPPNQDLAETSGGG